ncbi:MAG: hypothetical protein GY729_19510 [Desulfobacteraceae bacterium]|nr:hypothetical protein [Desulfobacteraceae bacterium]
MKEKLYKKEITITIIFSVLLLLMGHSASIFVLFPSLQTGTLWGFPVQYIVPILLGWFGIAAVCLVMTIVCNKFDDEMEEFVSQLPPVVETETDTKKIYE